MNTKEIKRIEIQLDGFTREGVEDCKQCLDPYSPPHFNCLYINRPNAIGHDKGQSGHCTARGCY